MSYQDRLRSARRHAGLTQSQLAQQVGVTQTSISDLERGKSAASSHTAQIAAVCGVSPLWLERGVGSMLDDISNVRALETAVRAPRRYPLITAVAAGQWRDCGETPAPNEAEEWLDSTENAGPHGYWLQVEGHSMTSPRGLSFPPGMYLLIQPEGFTLLSGKFYIARLCHADGRYEATFKQYQRDAGQDYLVPLNPDFKPIPMDERVQIIGRVIDAKLPANLF